MNYKFLASMILAGAAFASQQAFASDGTITFTGSISTQTCAITSGTSGSFTVTLPPVGASALASTGLTAGRTPFTIQLTGCNPTGNVHAYFEPGATTNASSGRLIVATGAGNATNVEIGLLNGDLSQINLGAADGVALNSKSVAIAAGGTATLPYQAQYVATGTATSGAVNSSVMYTLVYQ